MSNKHKVTRTSTINADGRKIEISKNKYVYLYPSKIKNP